MVSCKFAAILRLRAALARVVVASRLTWRTPVGAGAAEGCFVWSKRALALFFRDENDFANAWLSGALFCAGVRKTDHHIQTRAYDCGAAHRLFDATFAPCRAAATDGPLEALRAACANGHGSAIDVSGSVSTIEATLQWCANLSVFGARLERRVGVSAGLT